MSRLHTGARQRLASEAHRAVVDGPKLNFYQADLLHSSGQPLCPPQVCQPALPGRWCSPDRVPERVSPLAAPYSPWYRLALVKPEWSVGQNVVDPASIRGRPDAGDMGLSTERQCNLRRTRIKPIRTMSL